MSNPPSHLEPSALGTKEYWDNLYTTELSNHATNPSDVGTVWFDDSDAEAKIVSFLDDHGESDFSLSRSSSRILDLGCGNGSLLFALHDDGWTGNLLGVDYSEESVRLAQAVRKTRGEEEEGEGKETVGEVEFKEWDVLAGDFSVVGDEGIWDLILDKGTFDAVSLSGERDGKGRRICEGYGERVVKLLRKGGVFLVTSCNWTETELKAWFEGTNADVPVEGRLRQVGRIAYPSFSFGGVKGQTISTLCFEKVDG